MGTEILYPRDCLNERLRFNPPSFSPRRSSFTGIGKQSNPNPKTCRKQALRQELRKRSSSPPSKSAVSKNLALGQVRILKRGESLDFNTKNEPLKKTYSGDLVDFKRKTGISKKNETLKKTFSGDLLLCGENRLGPDPIRLKDLKPLNLRSDVAYAGLAFDSSPSPRLLPLPNFSIKKEGIVTVDDFATKDLRRLLGI